MKWMRQHNDIHIEILLLLLFLELPIVDLDNGFLSGLRQLFSPAVRGQFPNSNFPRNVCTLKYRLSCSSCECMGGANLALVRRLAWGVVGPTWTVNAAASEARSGEVGSRIDYSCQQEPLLRCHAASWHCFAGPAGWRA